MTAGLSVNLTGLFCWVGDLGIYLLLMDGGRFHVLHLDTPDTKLLGGRVRLTGQHAGGNVIIVDEMRRG